MTNSEEKQKKTLSEDEEFVRKVAERVWKLLERDLRLEHERDGRKRR